MIVNMVIVLLIGVMYPMPEGLKYSDTQGMTEYIATLPMIAFVLIMVAHLSQAFVGGWVAARISKNRLMLVAMIVGSLSLIGGLINVWMMPVPAWMWIELPLYLVVAWAAATFEMKRRNPLPTS